MPGLVQCLLEDDDDQNIMMALMSVRCLDVNVDVAYKP